MLKQFISQDNSSTAVTFVTKHIMGRIHLLFITQQNIPLKKYFEATDYVGINKINKLIIYSLLFATFQTKTLCFDYDLSRPSVLY